jgi:hypothetical protein
MEEIKANPLYMELSIKRKEHLRAFYKLLFLREFTDDEIKEFEEIKSTMEYLHDRL